MYGDSGGLFKMTFMKKRKKILIINGANINMLGVREPEIYGSENYRSLCRRIMKHACDADVSVKIKQSNHEGKIVDMIQSAVGKYDGIIINPGAYTHTSIAIADALRSVGIPCVEVHLTDPDNREEYRKISYIREICVRRICGKGGDGYIDAVDCFANGTEKS